MIKQTTELKTIYRSTEQPSLEQPHSSNIEDQRNINSRYGTVEQKKMEQKSFAISTRDQASIINDPSYLVPWQHSSSFWSKVFGLYRKVSNRTEPDRRNNEIHVTLLDLVQDTTMCRPEATQLSIVALKHPTSARLETFRLPSVRKQSSEGTSNSLFRPHISSLNNIVGKIISGRTRWPTCLWQH